jgi:hypothetical protein
MKLTHILLTTVASAAALVLSACDDGSKPATPVATAPAAPSPAPAAAPAPAPAATAVAGMTAPFATEAEWVASCTGAKLPDSVCTCVSKAAVKEIGVQGLYTWVWEGYVNRNAIAQGRSKIWFTKTGIDGPAQQKFADAVGKCYVSGK